MNRIIALLKMSIRILLRNKGFLFFLFVTPLLSTMVLSIQSGYGIVGVDGSGVEQIIELSDCDERAIYKSDNSRFVVKVYDGAKTELSEYTLNKLAATGMYSVCRCDVSQMTDEEIMEQAKKDAFDDRTGTIIYFKKGFDNAVSEGTYEAAVLLFTTSDDERYELFVEDLKNSLANVNQAVGLVDGDTTQAITILNDMDNSIPDRTIVNVGGKGQRALTDKQFSQKQNMGYAFAIITLGFLFCGVCVAHTVIEEQNNKVYTRVMLSQVSKWEYLFSKFIITVAMAVGQTVVTGVSILFILKDIDFGMSRLSFLFIIFCLGIIFGTISFVVGVLIGDVMSSNFAAFIIWNLSALLSGLYFPIDGTTIALKTMSAIMPHRWFMDAVDMVLVGDGKAYSMVLCVTAAYLIITVSLGCVGLKLKENEA